MKNERDCAWQRALRCQKQRFARFAASGMVMLELQFAILILGVGVAANLSIQTQALQRMIDTALRQEAALLQVEAALLERELPLSARLAISAPAETSSPPL